MHLRPDSGRRGAPSRSLDLEADSASGRRAGLAKGAGAGFAGRPRTSKQSGFKPKGAGLEVRDGVRGRGQVLAGGGHNSGGGERTPGVGGDRTQTDRLQGKGAKIRAGTDLRGEDRTQVAGRELEGVGTELKGGVDCRLEGNYRGRNWGLAYNRQGKETEGGGARRGVRPEGKESWKGVEF